MSSTSGGNISIPERLLSSRSSAGAGSLRTLYSASNAKSLLSFKAILHCDNFVQVNLSYIGYREHLLESLSTEFCTHKPVNEQDDLIISFS